MTSPPGEAPEASVQLASRTDVGQVRAANEDSCEIFVRGDGARLLIVADGMGGHRGGATASSTTVAAIGSSFTQSENGDPDASPGELLEAAIQGANARVYSMAKEDASLEGMGTTVVAFLLRAGLRGTVAHVGDSRAYRLRRGHLEPITTDHSVVAEMQRRGLLSPEEAAIHPRRNEILRSVGVLPEVDIEISEVDIKPGDRFLLCSDGLSGVVSDPEIAAIVQTESVDSAVDTLIRLANERGGPDNITVQILSIPADAEVEGDPEATADVEISEFGLEQIESKRRQRRLNRQIVSLIALLAIVIAAYFALGQLAGDPAPENTRPEPSDSKTSPFAAGSPSSGDGTGGSTGEATGDTSDTSDTPGDTTAESAGAGEEPATPSAAGAGPESSGAEAAAGPGESAQDPAAARNAEAGADASGAGETAAPEPDDSASGQDRYEIETPEARHGIRGRRGSPP